ncbi:MAG: hypothetical protein H7287_08555 [Thermoleophilia bacterium]|nr:hypothetical protein [Thermoleophilia bacterium]
MRAFEASNDDSGRGRVAVTTCSRVRLRLRAWGAVSGLVVLLALPGVAQACSGAAPVVARDAPNADGVFVGTVLLEVTERRAPRESDPEIFTLGHAATISLHHVFFTVDRVAAGSVPTTLIDVVDLDGCAMPVKPGDRVGVLLHRNRQTYIGSLFNTFPAGELDGVRERRAGRAFVSATVAGFVGLVAVLSAPHDRPEVAA